MAPINSSHTANLALVLALDPLGCTAAAWVQRVLCPSRAPYPWPARFLQLVDDGHDGYTFSPLGEHQPVETQNQPEPVHLPRQACQHLIASAPHLRTVIDQAMHDLRSHQDFIAAGIGNTQHLNLDIVILADLTHSATRGVLLPLSFLLQDWLAYEPYISGHLMVSTARFPDTSIHHRPDDVDEAFTGDPDNALGLEAAFYAALKEIDAAADLEQGYVRQTLASHLGIDRLDPLHFPVYLFDQRKEGVLEVRDPSELALIMGNFLLALLLGASKVLNAPGSDLECQENKGFFNSAAAAALVYEPAPLIEHCAARLGMAFLDEVLGAGEAQSQRQRMWVDGILGHLGSLPDWLEALCNGLACLPVAGPGSSDSAGYYLTWNLDDLNFAGIPPACWAETIRGYQTRFCSEKLSEFQAAIERNQNALSAKLAARLADDLAALPHDVLLRGGSLPGCLEILPLIENDIQQQGRGIASPGSLALPGGQGALEQHLQYLEAIANQPRQRPTLRSLWHTCREEVRRLPGSQQKSFNLVAFLSRCVARWLGKDEQALLNARSQCIRSLDRFISGQCQESLSAQLLLLQERLKNPLVQAHEDIDRLAQALYSAQTQLAAWTALPEQGKSPFRPALLDEQVATWAYRQWRPVGETMRQAVMEQARLLEDWQVASPDKITQYLMAYGRQVYAPLWRCTLAELPASTLSLQDQLPALLHGCVPLLRPNYDLIGGGGQTQEIRFILAEDTLQPAWSTHTNAPVAAWEWLNITEIHAGVCCRGRRFIPLAALRNLIRRGQKAYQELPEEARQALHLFPEWATPRVTEKTNGRCGLSVG